MSEPLPVEAFDYEYPEELIASRPAEPRDASRLLVLRRDGGAVEHRLFRDLPEYLGPGDCLVLNETKVFACRLVGRKSTGGKAELLLVHEAGPGRWTALASGLKAGHKLKFPGGLTAEVLGLTADGEYELALSRSDVPAYLAEHGLAPLPPYILKRKPDDAEARERYQTVYAREEGSIAAPTAGLHFTPALLDSLRAKGVTIAKITLHVGRGTFRPITAGDARAHVMLPERYFVGDEASALIKAARRVVSVGTTSTRTLETTGGEPGAGETSLYITPGHRWRVVGALITNFHLPRSTPLMLASAFAGRERLLAAYREAVRLRYRLYSYGDAMLIV